LSAACFASFWLTMHGISRIHSVSKSDDELGGLWALVATVFVFRTSYEQGVTAALSRTVATTLGCLLCLIYLLVLPFHALGLALLIGLEAVGLTVAGRPQDVATAGITSAVVLVVAALSPHDAWKESILRFADTAVGVVVALLAARLWLVVTRALRSRQGHNQSNSRTPRRHRYATLRKWHD
jgi:uncharacterized membrane protein YccC